MAAKIRKGDTVVVIAGNDKGKIGIVKSAKDDKVVVYGVNMRKKHVKRSQETPQGSIIDFEAPIHISNVMICVDNKGVKLKVKKDEAGNRQFFYKDGDNEIVYRSVKKPK